MDRVGDVEEVPGVHMRKTVTIQDVVHIVREHAVARGVESVLMCSPLFVYTQPMISDAPATCLFCVVANEVAEFHHRELLKLLKTEVD